MMMIGKDEAAKVAHLARIKVEESELDTIASELSAIIGFMQELNAVDVDDVEAMTTATPMELSMREDTVRSGGLREKLMTSAPLSSEGFYLVPKVVE